MRIDREALTKILPGNTPNENLGSGSSGSGNVKGDEKMGDDHINRKMLQGRFANNC